MSRQCTIPLGGEYAAVVDAADFEWLSRWEWSAHASRGIVYAVRRVATPSGLAKIWMHREIIQAPAEAQVDHRNRNGLDNRRENLRLATSSQNGANRDYSWRARSVPYRGVYRRPNGSFTVIVRHHGVARSYGTYADMVEAAHVFDREASRLHGEFAVLNFPLERAA